MERDGWPISSWAEMRSDAEEWGQTSWSCRAQSDLCFCSTSWIVGCEERGLLDGSGGSKSSPHFCQREVRCIKGRMAAHWMGMSWKKLRSFLQLICGTAPGVSESALRGLRATAAKDHWAAAPGKLLQSLSNNLEIVSLCFPKGLRNL